MKSVTIATVCMKSEYSPENNLKKYMEYIEQAKEKGADLVVFPEASLQGYLNSLKEVSFDSVDYQHAHAEPIPEGPGAQKLIEAAKSKNIYIVWGMIERDPDRVGILYNTAVLAGPEGYIGKYRKVHQPMDEFHVFVPGGEWPVFDTKIGKIGMLICYDKSFPESARELALGGAEILVMPTAWSREYPGCDVEKDLSILRYNMYDQVRAMENQVFFVSSNQVGVCGDIDYCGFSQIVSPDGVVLATTRDKEGMAVCDVGDVRGEIVASRTKRAGGVWTFKDRKPETYTRIPQYLL